MQKLRTMAMAASCLHQVAVSSLSKTSRSLVVPCKADGLRSLSTSVLERTWACPGDVVLRSALVRPALIAASGRFNVIAQGISTKSETMVEESAGSATEVTSLVIPDGQNGDVPAQLKTKKLTKQVKHIMNILNAEALEAATKDKVVPTLRPGDVVQLRVEVPENKRRVSVLRGIVIAIHNAGINSTFRIRRVLAGVGVEMIFPLYSPNIKEMKVVDKRRARRAKLYYLRDKIARLSSC